VQINNNPKIRLQSWHSAI